MSCTLIRGLYETRWHYVRKTDDQSGIHTTGCWERYDPGGANHIIEQDEFDGVPHRCLRCLTDYYANGHVIRY